VVELSCNTTSRAIFYFIPFILFKVFSRTASSPRSFSSCVSFAVKIFSGVDIVEGLKNKNLKKYSPWGISFLIKWNGRRNLQTYLAAYFFCQNFRPISIQNKFFWKLIVFHDNRQLILKNLLSNIYHLTSIIWFLHHSFSVLCQLLNVNCYLFLNLHHSITLSLFFLYHFSFHYIPIILFAFEFFFTMFGSGLFTGGALGRGALFIHFRA